MNIQRLYKLVQDKVTEWNVKQMSLPEGEERAIYRGAIKALYGMEAILEEMEREGEL